MKILMIALLAAGCGTPSPPTSQPEIKPQSSCGAICSSNQECMTGLIPTCKFCNFGVCRAVRPESEQVDAGVDAP